MFLKCTPLKASMYWFMYVISSIYYQWYLHAKKNKCIYRSNSFVFLLSWCAKSACYFRGYYFDRQYIVIISCASYTHVQEVANQSRGTLSWTGRNKHVHYTRLNIYTHIDWCWHIKSGNIIAATFAWLGLYHFLTWEMFRTDRFHRKVA